MKTLTCYLILVVLFLIGCQTVQEQPQPPIIYFKPIEVASIEMMPENLFGEWVTYIDVVSDWQDVVTKIDAGSVKTLVVHPTSYDEVDKSDLRQLVTDHKMIYVGLGVPETTILAMLGLAISPNADDEPLSSSGLYYSMRSLKDTSWWSRDGLLQEYRREQFAEKVVTQTFWENETLPFWETTVLFAKNK